MLLYCKVFNIFHTVISILFFTSPYNIFVFQSTITNWRLVFLFLFFIYTIILLLFLSTLYYFVMVFFLYHLSLSLSIGNLSFSKIWWWFYDIKYALLVFFFFLVFLTWFFFFISFFLWCIGCENECFPSITPLNIDNFIYVI